MPREIIRRAVILTGLLSASLAAAADVQPLLKTMQAVGPGGKGQVEAAAAWRQLVAQADAADLPAVLAGLDHAGPLAANWIRTAMEAIAERQVQRGGKLPIAELEAFLLDRRHAPRARRLAYEWLARVDATAPERLVPGMLNDPSDEMRRDAVARLIRQAEQDKTTVGATYDLALTGAVDIDQIRLLAERLEKLGRHVDLPRILGFVVRWKLIGPFDNTGGKGFDTAYPPERAVERRASVPARPGTSEDAYPTTQAAYEGKHGTVRWIEHTSTDELGQIDFNRVLGTEKGVAGYATSEFLSPQRQEVEFRLATLNAVKLWLNGRLIDQHNVYHSGTELDQYVGRGVLEKGRNTILVKLCQNEQKQDWAVYWRFQLRVCNEQGKAVVSADRW